MRLTRGRFLAGAAAAAASAAGLYELIDGLAKAPPRSGAGVLPLEQHLLEGLRVLDHEGVEVVVPPLHHQLVTAKVELGPGLRSLRVAQGAFEELLRALEREFEPTPAGLGLTVAWGRPYFRRYVPRLAKRHLPIDLRASRAERKRVTALLDAIRFPSDPAETVLEQNDLAILLRSDVREHVGVASARLLREFDFLRPTSVRKGFAGGGFGGGRSLPKQLALAAGIPGAGLIPESAQLFLGFTSTQKASLGPGRIANVETLGYADLREGYFEGGTHMHLSHLFEDVEAWYLNFDFSQRAETVFRPGLSVPVGAQTVSQAAEDAQGPGEVARAFARSGAIGHSGAIQTASRLQQDVVGTDGVRYQRGTAVPQRADFNTLDNPFFWTAAPGRDGYSGKPAAGVHFVVFNPTSDDFHRNRLAMDGQLPDGTRLPLRARVRGQGINEVLRTTHRQNFIVPPRRHRSFPLAELLS